MASPWAFKQMRSHRRLDLPGHHLTRPEQLKKNNAVSAPEISFVEVEEEFTNKLFQNLELIATTYSDNFEEYVVDNLPLETISSWLAKKISWLKTQKTKDQKKEHMIYEGSDDLEDTLEQNYKSIIISPIDDVSASCPAALQEITKQFESGDYLRSLYSICSYLQVATLSSGFRLYSTESGSDTLQVYNPSLPQWENVVSTPQRCNISRNVPTDTKTTAAMHVALTLEPIVLDDVMMDDRFLSGCDSSAIALMCLPIVLPNGDLIAVAEFHRSWHFVAYTNETLQMIVSLFNCLSLAIVKSESHEKAKRYNVTNDFLLEVSKAYLDDMDKPESISQHITKFAKKMVNANRGMLLLYDQGKDDLYSNYFDIGNETLHSSINITKTTVRFSASTGIAGEAAESKRIVVLADAYTDPKFNTDFDIRTGLKTKSIICVPLFIGEQVYGVVALTNKKGSPTLIVTDKESLEKLAAIGALALKYFKNHTTLLKHQWRLAVLKEQYIFYSCQYLEVDLERLEEAQELVYDYTPPNFHEFEFFFTCQSDEMMAYFIKMLHDVIPEDALNIPNDVLSRFIVAVRNNYRENPYHNWLHAMTATHTLYCILKKNRRTFSLVEKLSLLIAMVCHDLDHQTLSNQYLQNIEHPMALLHRDSPLEYHHFAMTMDILSRENHNLLECLSPAEHEEATIIIKKAILATDLAYHFESRRRVKQMLQSQTDLQDPTYRDEWISVMLTACDLSSTVKEFDISKTLSDQLFEEFWAEGDLCKMNGLPVGRMVDRNYADFNKEGQVIFYDSVVLECYETLSQLLPSCEPMAVSARMNLERWRREAEKSKARCKEKRRSYPLMDNQEEQITKDNEFGIFTGGMWNVVP